MAPKANFNILFINPAGCIGGAEKSLIDLVTGLPRERFRPLVVTLGPGPLFGELLDRGIEAREFLLPPALLTLSRKSRLDAARLLLTAPFLLPPLIGRLIRLIREERIDLVDTNGIKAHLLAILPALLTGRVLVWHFRDLPGRGIHGRIFRLLARLFPARIIANSAAVRRQLGDRDKIRVVYNGVELPPAPTEERRRELRAGLNLDRKNTAVGAIGHLAPLKGYEDFLAAMPEILEQVPSARFLITGEALYSAWQDYRRRLESEASRLGISQAVIFTGGRKDPKDILPALDIFVLPSRSEGFGRANLEAMAAGLPVVSTNVGGIPEVVIDGETGVLVPPNRPRALAEAVISLAGDRARRTAMGAAGRRRAREFSLEKMVNETRVIYQEILNGRTEGAGDQPAGISPKI